ncbi:hypothetical protein HMPREF9374_2939 [Desmospora sp. 8437]|nr:hypothetical protein HMPREF9374_2939 [Desmospora sp. 8437]
MVSLLAFGFALHPGTANAQYVLDVEDIEVPANLTEFSETTAEILSEDIHRSEIMDLTGLKQEEVDLLDDADYMEYQM